MVPLKKEAENESKKKKADGPKWRYFEKWQITKSLLNKLVAKTPRAGIKQNIDTDTNEFVRMEVEFHFRILDFFKVQHFNEFFEQK